MHLFRKSMLYLPLINLLWLSFWIPVVYVTNAFPQVKDFYREATPTRRPLENLHLESIREYLESVWEMPIMVCAVQMKSTLKSYTRH